jgi:hypothetical protein
VQHFIIVFLACFFGLTFFGLLFLGLLFYGLIFCGRLILGCPRIRDFATAQIITQSRLKARLPALL